jgi:photosystem II stability/assembly factor-like uncharacterized protein
MHRFFVLVASGSLCIAVALAASPLGVGRAVASPPQSGGFTSAVRSQIPEGFRAQSLAWISPTVGRMLGTAPCGLGSCTTVVGTADGGQRWSLLGTMAAPLAPPGERGVTKMRFADDLHGWAFGPSLFVTSDGGQSWRPAPLPGGARQVIALAAGPTAVYALVSPCRIGQPEYLCEQPSALWRSSVDGKAWRQVPLHLPVTFVGALALRGSVGYLAIPRLAPEQDVFFATIDGRTWTRRPSPCAKDRNEALVDVAPIQGQRVGLLCIGDPGFSKSVKRVFRSSDAGETASYAGTAPLSGIASQLAATPDGTLAMASTSDGSWIYRNTGGQEWTTAFAADHDGGAGWNDLAFTTELTGFVVYAPAAWADGAGSLTRTTDAGASWVRVRLDGTA